MEIPVGSKKKIKNPVAKNMEAHNRPMTHVDRKKEAKKQGEIRRK